MPVSKARQVIAICKAKEETVCPQYIIRKFIKFLSEQIVAISVFHKRDCESDGLTTDNMGTLVLLPHLQYSSEHPLLKV